MAPFRDPTSVPLTIKEILQHLYDLQVQTHGFAPETSSLLIDKMEALASSLGHLQSLASPTENASNPIHQLHVAPEIVDYVDDSRNPDIFTRDFVELVQRGNAVVNGKKRAFRDFSELYAEKLKEGIPGVGREVDRIMEEAGFWKGGVRVDAGEGGQAGGQANGSSHVEGGANGRGASAA